MVNISVVGNEPVNFSSEIVPLNRSLALPNTHFSEIVPINEGGTAK